MPEKPVWPEEVTAVDVVRHPPRLVVFGCVLLAAILLTVVWIATEVHALRAEIVSAIERDKP